MPRVALATGEPRERAERPRDPGAEDGGLGADGEHVRADRDQYADLGGEPRNAEEERQPQRAYRDDGDVAAADGQEVIEAARTEILPEARAQALLLPEDDAFEHGAALAPEAGDGVAREPGVEPVGHTTEAPAPADDVPGVGAENDVDAVPAEPGPLVESVLRTARLTQLSEQREPGALRRGASGRELEQRRLVGA